MEAVEDQEELLAEDQAVRLAAKKELLEKKEEPSKSK